MWYVPLWDGLNHLFVLGMIVSSFSPMFFLLWLCCDLLCNLSFLLNLSSCVCISVYLNHIWNIMLILLLCIFSIYWNIIIITTLLFGDTVHVETIPPSCVFGLTLFFFVVLVSFLILFKSDPLLVDLKTYCKMMWDLLILFIPQWCGIYLTPPRLACYCKMIKNGPDWTSLLPLYETCESMIPFFFFLLGDVFDN